MSEIETVYLIHHSHTDIGYTHDQPIIWDLHERFIDEAVKLAGKYAESNTAGAFRWTVENTQVLYEWLKHSSAEQVKRFVELERAGRIEVTGMFANITPLVDTDQLIESLQLVSRLREEYGFTITHAMNCDVNGEPWPLVDSLLDMKIEGFSMAINTQFGGAPLNRPEIFWWQGPSGRKILAYAGWACDAGWRFGIGRDEKLFKEWWPRIQQRMDEIDYPMPVLMMQSFHPFGDNGSAFGGFTSFIDEWNANNKSPHLVLATPEMWWNEVKRYAGKLPTYSGDWTDFWNFGCISSARETAINRGNRSRLRTADLVSAALIGLETPLSTTHTARVVTRYRDDAWKFLHLWDEHTWGADQSVQAPENESTASQWYHKAAYAYQARSLSLMLQRDALADFSHYVERQNSDDLLIFNPLPWRRILSGVVPYNVATPRGLPEDTSAGRHFQDQVGLTDLLNEPSQLQDHPKCESQLGIQAIEIPGYGFKVIHRSELVELRSEKWSEETVTENKRHRLTFDVKQGGVTSWFDKQLNCELVDSTAGYPLSGFVFEEVSDHTIPWPRSLIFNMDLGSEQVEPEQGWKTNWHANRMQPTEVLDHRVYSTLFGQRIIQTLNAPGVTGSLIQSVFMPTNEDYVEFESWWMMGQKSHPEGTYIMFPFNIPNAAVRIDLGGQSFVAGKDQIPGVCCDYYTAQKWIDLSNKMFGVTVALPDNPMVQFGDFHFGKNRRRFTLERAMLLGWVTNNYWDTNFRAQQPGEVHARYRVYPHSGGFEPVSAYRVGMETENNQLLLQHMGEPTERVIFPAVGELLKLPETLNPSVPVFTLHIKPARAGSGLVIRLYNASDSPQQTCIDSGLLTIKAAQSCDLSEAPELALKVVNGHVDIVLPARRVTTIKLAVREKETS